MHGLEQNLSGTTTSVVNCFVFFQSIHGSHCNLVLFAQQTKEAFFNFFFFGERECIFTRFLSSSAVIRAGATTSTVSLMTLLLSFVTYNLQ